MSQACSFIKKEALERCFPVNFAKFLRTLFLKNISRRQAYHDKCYCHKANKNILKDQSLIKNSGMFITSGSHQFFRTNLMAVVRKFKVIFDWWMVCQRLIRKLDYALGKLWHTVCLSFLMSLFYFHFPKTKLLIMTWNSSLLSSASLFKNALAFLVIFFWCQSYVTHSFFSVESLLSSKNLINIQFISL